MIGGEDGGNITSVIQVLVMLWFKRDRSSKPMQIKHVLNHLTGKRNALIIN